MQIEKTNLEDILVITPEVFKDDRGYFMESYNKSVYTEKGIDISFVQDNMSRSKHGVLRGLHFQKSYPQAKLISVVEGSVFDVAVDLRSNSETFGEWFGIKLTADNKKQLLIPAGCAHGFLTLSEFATINYKCSEYYHPESDCGVVWNDSDINIDWPIAEVTQIVLSDKDESLPTLVNSDVNKTI